MKLDDEYLWAVAETGSDEALEELIRRYPSEAERIRSRRAAARALKRSRPAMTPVSAPLGARPVVARRRPLIWVVGPAAALGIAIALSVWRFAPAPEPIVVPAPTPDAPRPNLPVVAQRTDTGLKGPPPETIHLRGAKLGDAIRLLLAREGRTAEIAPGLPEAVVAEDLTTAESDPVDALGKRYGFTAFDQGNGTVLVIPAREDRIAQ